MNRRIFLLALPLLTFFGVKKPGAVSVVSGGGVSAAPIWTAVPNGGTGFTAYTSGEPFFFASTTTVATSKRFDDIG